MATTLKSLSVELELARAQLATLVSLPQELSALRAEVESLRNELAELKAQRPAPLGSAPPADRPAPYMPGEVISTYPARRSSTGWEAKVQSAKPNVTNPVSVTEAFARSFTKGTRGVFLVSEQRVATPAPAASRARTMSPEEAASYAQYAY